MNPYTWGQKVFVLVCVCDKARKLEQNLTHLVTKETSTVGS